MKVGLCIAFKGTNYGMLLQGFATQLYIERLGFETEIIDYISTSDKRIRLTPWLLVFGAKKIKDRMTKKSGPAVDLDSFRKENILKRQQVADRFRNEKLHTIISAVGMEELIKVGRRYDTVLVGSDQQWPPDIAFTNFRTLRFVDNATNKVSYATSLGVSKYPLYAKSSAKQYWKRFQHLSVREQEGKDIITSIWKDANVEVVVDPTYLFSKEEWEEIIPVAPVLAERYVLCYELGASQRLREHARKYADSLGLPLVSILSDEMVGPNDCDYSDVVITGATVDEFVNLIRHADRVFTDSFHGATFSVINNIEFNVYYRVRPGVQSRNSRIDNLLRLWGLSDRLVLDDSPDFSLVDYDSVNGRIDEKRQQSIAFLKGALGV